MTQIRLTNSATRRKEDFTPLDPDNVRVYVCGPTVYDRAHMGNARPAIVFDVLYRLLRHVYGEGHVTYVRNITDVDDKINARAAETGRPIREITDETTGWYFDDMAALGNLVPDATPRATDYIDRMIAMIETLAARGHAYAAEGHVLFSVASHQGYGALSGRSVEDMLAGARVEVAPYKRDPMDFVLWKPSGPGQPGWDSPWGNGRPGWHIECSAMAANLLGERFDIHGGGNDLMFPHHENEIAQSACAHDGAAMAQVWLHNEMLQVEGKKMSKSLGNFFTVRDLLDRDIPGEVIRFVFLGTHYRSPMDWTEEKQFDAEDRLRWYHSIISKYDDVGAIDPNAAPPDPIIQAVADDLNIHLALVRIHALAKTAETEMGNGSAARDLAASLKFLGLLNKSAASEPQSGWLGHSSKLSTDDQFKIQNLMSKRRQAKQDRDFERADEIRDRLKVAGVLLKDTHTGSTYEVTRNFDSAKLGGIV